MSTVPQRKKHQLRVSSYDKVSSWIVALLVITCVTVGALFIIYITSRFIIDEYAVPVTPISTGGGGTGGVGGAAGDGEPDSPEEAAAFDEPQMQDTLAAITSAVTTRTTMLTDEQIDVTQNTESRGDNRTPGFGGGRGGGVGGGIGSGFVGRGGPPGPDRAIRFEPSSVQEFAEWLDFFKIELAVLDQENNKIHYAKNLAQQKPTVTVVDAAKQQEARIPMTPTDAQFVALDRELAKKAGIADKGEIIVQLYPTETIAILMDLEQKHAGTRKPDTIRGTVFRVTRTGRQFQFSVISQTYRY